MSDDTQLDGERSTQRRLLFAAMTFGLVVMAILVLGEILVRVLFRYNTPDTVRENSLQLRESVYTRSLMLPNQRPDLSAAWGLRTGEEPVAVSFVINEHGYRGASFALEKTAGTCRVIVLGGSAVFDILAPDGRDWPHLVEERLRSAGYLGVEVINAGVPGFASSDSLGRLWTEVWMLKPDYLLLYNAWNDIKYFRSLSLNSPLGQVVTPFREGADPFRYYQGNIDRVLSTLQLYVKLRTRYYSGRIRVDTEGALPEGGLASGSYWMGLAQYRLNVALFVKASKMVGAVPVLATQATLATADLPEEERERINYGYTGLDHAALVRAFSSSHEVVRSVADEEGAELIDAARFLSGRLELFDDHVHTTPQGSEALAALVADHLAPMLAEGCGSRSWSFLANAREVD